MSESKIKLQQVEPFTRWMETRFPFRYGIASMTRLPHLFLRVTIEIDGKPVQGICSEGLPPKWFTKNPDTTFEEDLPALVGVIQQAAKFAQELDPAESVFQWWRELHHCQERWAAENEVPPLLANLGVSLIERGVIDAFCRGIAQPFGSAIRENRFGIELGDIHKELTDRAPAEFLPNQPLQTVSARHTVGLGDPLHREDIPQEDLADDSLPQALTDCIDCYGLRYFKIKLLGDFEKDHARLVELAGLLEEKSPKYQYTLDGNEQFRDIDAFQDHWDRHRANPKLETFLSREHLLFVEQPLHRDTALSPEVGSAFAGWKDAPPVIIDESDSEPTSLRSALEVGYSGTSHKNCKGVFKGVANACLLAHLRAENPQKEHILSGEDLANVGPVALLQDLAVMASLGIDHVERNGHHYFNGLAAFPQEINRQVAGDLYEINSAGHAVVKISDGQLSTVCIAAAPFGTGIDPGDDDSLRLLGDAGWPS